jgi:hypothetical protein
MVTYNCKEYFSYDYDLAKSGFLFLVNSLKLLFSFKEIGSMILGESSLTLAAKGDISFLYLGIVSVLIHTCKHELSSSQLVCPWRHNA